MRLLYVVQRYGETIAGGAEQHCREIAERMAARGHRVTVLTTCAEVVRRLADAYRTRCDRRSQRRLVHRFRVAAPATIRTSSTSSTGAWSARRGFASALRATRMDADAGSVVAGSRPVARPQRRPFRRRGLLHVPLLDQPGPALDALRGRVPTRPAPDRARRAAAAPLDVRRRVPRARCVRAVSRPRRSISSAERFPVIPPGAVVGIGVEVGAARSGSFPRHGTGSAPSRTSSTSGGSTEGKGALSPRLLHRVQEPSSAGRSRARAGRRRSVHIPERRRHRGDRFRRRPDPRRRAGGRLALVHPSFFESFSMILTEAFAHRPSGPRAGPVRGAERPRPPEQCRAALRRFRRVRVRGRRCSRGPGAGRRDGCGRAGEYVEREYTWDIVLERYEALLERTAANARK